MDVSRKTNKGCEAFFSFDKLFERVTDRVLGGEPVDVQKLCADYPEHADELRRMLPTVRAMASVSNAPQEKRTAVDTAEEHVENCTLGDFRLRHEIGRGGMGVVYEAEQTSLGRSVAVKVLPLAAILDQRQLERFKSEACAAAMLKHPNIVNVYSVGCERGIHYYAMELVHGHSLADLMIAMYSNTTPETEPVKAPPGANSSQSGPANERTEPVAALSTQRLSDRKAFQRSVARLGIQVAEGLRYAHREGVIHRDIKPSNLLIDRDGKLWITDFGLARIQGAENLTMTGDVVGTLRYMSPERLDDDKMADQRSDIYSLGLTLYELLTGRPAIAGKSRQHIMQQVLEGNITPPTRWDRSISQDLETIVLKAIAAEPTDRYGTATALKEDLEKFLEHRPINARRLSQSARTLRWARHNPLIASLAASVMVLLLMVALGSSLFAWKSIEQARDMQRRDYARDMQLVSARIQAGDYVDAERILQRWIPSQGEADSFRHFEWSYLWKRCHTGVARRTIVHDFAVFDAAYSDDGGLLAISTFLPRINIWNAKTGQRHDKRWPGSHMVGQLLRIPGTNKLVSSDSSGQTVISDFQTGNELARIAIGQQPENGWTSSIDVSPDENFVAIGAGYIAQFASTLPASVHIWDRTKDQLVKQLTGFSGRVYVAFVDGGSTLAIGSHDDAIKLYDVADWQVKSELPAALSGVTEMSRSPDGSLLAVASAKPRSAVAADTQIDVWETDTWSRRLIHSKHEGAVRSLSFSNDGSLLAAGSEDHAISVADTRTGGTTVLRQAHSDMVGAVTFTPDAKYLCSCGYWDTTARVWSVSDLLSPKEDEIRFRQHLGSVRDAVFIDDGSTVCSTDRQANLLVWDVATRNVKKTISGSWRHGRLCTAVRVSR